QEFQLTRKNYMLTGIAALFIALTLLSYSWYKRYQLKQSAALQAAVMKQQELATKAIIEAEENERQRIAGDLHDGVGQMMSAAKINLSTVSDGITFASEEQRTRFENALKLVDDSCSEVRTVSHNIMPNSLLRNSLAAAVRTFINKIDQHVLKINLHTEGLNEKLDENIEIMLYRVVQECVNNVIKHAKANILDISLIKDGHEISVTIEDNGIGFDTTDKTKFDGIGMKNIASRIQYLKGTVEWDSGRNKGTVVSIQVPLT
ncbi:MAG: sensor histidine kinase, partial [Chitinophagaceae bacterium]|nr:sensor histidine kinase [Chitinophagaceae bacterium]